MSEPDDPIDMDTEHSPAATESREILSGSHSQSKTSNMAVTATPSQSQHSKEQPTSTENAVIDVDKEPVKVVRREMATRSDMWAHFKQVKNAANVVVSGECKYCSRSIKAESKGYGTSSLRRHFNACKRNPHKMIKDPTQALLQRTPGEAPGNFKYDPEALRDAFAEMIIQDELPFSFGEKSGFRKFMALACPRFHVPSRRTTTRDAVIDEIFGEEKGKLVWEAVVTCLHDLFEEYRQTYAPTEGTAEVEGTRASKGGRGTMLKEAIAKKLKMNNGASSNAKSELDKYLAEDCEDQELKFDILAWWKINAVRFPILAHLARDLLAIPITSVASESAFSTGGRILDDFRSSLTPFMLEALVCGQDWLRRSTPIDIQENLEELAIMEKELIEEFGGMHIAKGKGKGGKSKASTEAESKPGPSS